MKKEVELHYTAYTLSQLSRYLWGGESTEFLAGALQSVVTEKQMQALINNLHSRVKLMQKLKETDND